MTTWQSLNKGNQEMVDKFTRLAIIQTKEVENAFRCVNRAAFVSNELLSEAFSDVPIKGSPHLHMSAPHIYATILEDLDLEPGMYLLYIHSNGSDAMFLTFFISLSCVDFTMLFFYCDIILL